jgi:hypothetical protein
VTATPCTGLASTRGALVSRGVRFFTRRWQSPSALRTFPLRRPGRHSILIRGSAARSTSKIQARTTVAGNAAPCTTATSVRAYPGRCSPCMTGSWIWRTAEEKIPRPSRARITRRRFSPPRNSLNRARVPLLALAADRTCPSPVRHDASDRTCFRTSGPLGVCHSTHRRGADRTTDGHRFRTSRIRLTAAPTGNGTRPSRDNCRRTGGTERLPSRRLGSRHPRPSAPSP